MNLNQREKYIVTGGAACLLIFLVFFLVVSPLLTERARLTRALEQKTADIIEVRGLQADYHMLQKKAGRAKANLAKRDKDFSLYSFLDSLAREAGLSVSSMNQRSSSSQDDTNIKTSTVELKLQDITMEQLSNYLYRVEYSGNNLYVKRMSISETTKPEGFIDVVLEVETVKA